MWYFNEKMKNEGTTQMFAAPYFTSDLHKKVALFGAFGPATYMYNCKSPLFVILADLHVDQIFELLGVQQFLPGLVLDKVGADLCSVVDDFCVMFLEFICGPTQDLNASRTEVYISKTPAGTSVKNMAHWAQGIRRDRFEMYDYGTPERNEQVYGQREPPQYDLSALSIPTAFYSGSNDWLADPEDVQVLLENVNPDIIVQNKTVNGFAHLDFVWGVHANTRVYDDLLLHLYNYLGPGRRVSSASTTTNGQYDRRARIHAL